MRLSYYLENNQQNGEADCDLGAGHSRITAFPGEGFTLSQMIETFLRAIDASDFENRLRQLEEDQAARREDTAVLRHNWAARFDSSPRRD